MNKDIKITQTIANDIYSAGGGSLENVINKIPLGICSVCTAKYNGAVKIKVDEYYLNDLGDIILRGRCGKCNKPMNRYLETGENPKILKKAQKYLNNKSRGK